MVAKCWLIRVGLCCLFAIGCGSDGKPRRVPVTGTVTYNGKPLPGGDVVFVPADTSNGFRARGKANERGQFTLTTFDDGDGGMPGEYKVTAGFGATMPTPQKGRRSSWVWPSTIRRAR